MAVTTFGIICRTSTLMVLAKVINLEDDSQLSPEYQKRYPYAGPGEMLFVAPLSNGTDDASCRAFVQQKTGRTPMKPVPCAIVDQTNTVVSLVMADPAIDVVQSCTVMSADGAGVGWKYSGGKLTDPTKADAAKL